MPVGADVHLDLFRKEPGPDVGKQFKVFGLAHTFRMVAGKFLNAGVFSFPVINNLTVAVLKRVQDEAKMRKSAKRKVFHFKSPDLHNVWQEEFL